MPTIDTPLPVEFTAPKVPKRRGPAAFAPRPSIQKPRGMKKDSAEATKLQQRMELRRKLRHLKLQELQSARWPESAIKSSQMAHRTRHA